MAANYYEVDMIYLSRNTAELKAKVDQMRVRLEEMLTSIAEMDGMWEGAANRIFKQQFMEDSESFSEYCDSLERLADSMAYATKEYNACENEVLDAINAIQL